MGKFVAKYLRFMLRKLLLFCFCLGNSWVYGQEIMPIYSPNHQLRLSVVRSVAGSLTYQLGYKSKEVIGASSLGIVLKKPAVSLQSFEVLGVDTLSHNEIWTPVWGEEREIRNQYAQLIVHGKSEGILVDFIFRVFNDGIGFRYHFRNNSAFSILS